MTANRAAKLIGAPVSSTYRKLAQETKSVSPANVTAISVPSPPDPRSDEFIKDKMRGIKKKHPFWGHRRLRARLKKQFNIRISRKRANRLAREINALCEKKCSKPERKHIPQPVALKPNKAWQIDMTSFVLQQFPLKPFPQ